MKSFRMNFERVFRKIFIVINRIHDFEFAVNFAILLHYTYNFSQRGFVKGGGRFFFQESLYTGYGHSFFTYIFNMIDGFQDLLFHFSKLIITFSKDTWYQWWLCIVIWIEYFEVSRILWLYHRTRFININVLPDIIRK